MKRGETPSVPPLSKGTRYQIEDILVKKLFFLISLVLCIATAVPPFAAAASDPLSRKGTPAQKQKDEEQGTAGPVGVIHAIKMPAKDQKIAALLAQAKQLDASGNINGIFKQMGSRGVGFKDMVAFKAGYINSNAAALQKDGVSGGDAVKQAQELWNSEYRPIEQKMVNARKNLVKLVWTAALIDYIKANPKSPILAKGDIGGWATETIEKMRFEGDIDFTIFAVEAEHAVALRDLFEKKLIELFGMDMRQFDALCTAHGKAAFDVYIKEWGGKFGELDMAKRGKAQKIVVGEDGSIRTVEVDGKDMLKIYHEKKGTLSDDTFNPTADMEPGISMEFLRHITAEIVRGKFSTVEKIIKMCKYVDRSSKDHARLLGSFAKGGDTRLGTFAFRVTEAKENGKSMGEAIERIFALTDDFLGKGWADDPAKAIQELADRSQFEMKRNIAEAIEFHEKRISDISDPAKKIKEQEWLRGVLDAEKQAFSHDSVEFPQKAQETLDKLNRSADAWKFFGEKAADYVKVMSAEAGGAKLAMAYLLAKADQDIDRVNNFLDYLDNKTIENLRRSDVGIEYVQGERVLAKISVGSINEKLNQSVLGKIGNSTAFKGFNLGQEAYAYYDAYTGAQNAQEGMKNIAIEIFRRRVPGGSIAEAAIMENYGRAALETAYLVFPPLAIPEAIYGIAQSISTMSVNYYWGAALKEVADDIFAYSVFKPVEGTKGGKWKLVKLRYNGKEYPALEDFLTQNKDNKAGQAFFKAVEGDAAVAEYTRLIHHPSAGDRYRSKLEKLRDERYLQAQKDLLVKVIEELEKRMAGEVLGQGIGKERIKEIREALGCGPDEPLVSEADSVEVDGENYRKVMEQYEKHIAGVKKIDELSAKTGVKLAHYKPICTLESLERASTFNPELPKRYENMIGEIIAKIKEIKGSFDWADPEDRKDLADLLDYRKLAEPDLSKLPADWKKKYEEKLAEIAARYGGSVTDIVVTPEEVFAGKKMEFEAKISLQKKEGAVYEWTFSGAEYEGLKGKDALKGECVPKKEGLLKMTFRIIRNNKTIGERNRAVDVLALKPEKIIVKNPGRDYVDKENPSIQLSAFAELSDGTLEEVTGKAQWRVVSGDAVWVDAKGKVSLVKPESFTPPAGSEAEVEAAYEGLSGKIAVKYKIAMKSLRGYWETDPKYPEIPANSDPRGVLVYFRAVTDDPENDSTRTFTWEFQNEDNSYTAREGIEVPHFYTKMGRYGVTLTVKDQWGNSDETHDAVTIEEERVEEAKEEPVKEAVQKEPEKGFETPQGYANMYKGKGGAQPATIIVGRYDWVTPMGKRGGFTETPAQTWNYVRVGHFNPDWCLKTGPIEKGTAFNPGYLIYYSDAEKAIHYAVLGKGDAPAKAGVGGKAKPDYSHSGIISESAGNVVKESIIITEVFPRSFKISWDDIEGNKWSATVWKYADRGGGFVQGYADVKCLGKISKEEQALADSITKDLQEMLTSEKGGFGDLKELEALVEEEVQKMTAEEKAADAKKEAELQKKTAVEQKKADEVQQKAAEKIKEAVKTKIKTGMTAAAPQPPKPAVAAVPPSGGAPQGIDWMAMGTGSGSASYRDGESTVHYEYYTYCHATRPVPFLAFVTVAWTNLGLRSNRGNVIVDGQGRYADSTGTDHNRMGLWQCRVFHGKVTRTSRRFGQQTSYYVKGIQQGS